MTRIHLAPVLYSSSCKRFLRSAMVFRNLPLNAQQLRNEMLFIAQPPGTPVCPRASPSVPPFALAPATLSAESCTSYTNARVHAACKRFSKTVTRGDSSLEQEMRLVLKHPFPVGTVFRNLTPNVQQLPGFKQLFTVFTERKQDTHPRRQVRQLSIRMMQKDDPRPRTWWCLSPHRLTRIAIGETAPESSTTQRVRRELHQLHQLTLRPRRS